MGRVITSPGLIWAFSGQGAAGDPARPADQLRQNHEETTPGKNKDTVEWVFGSKATQGKLGTFYDTLNTVYCFFPITVFLANSAA